MFKRRDVKTELFRDPQVRRRLRYEAVEDKRPSRFSRRWDLVYLIKSALEKNRHLEGKSVPEIARMQQRDVIDVFLDLSLEEGLDTEFQT